MSIGASDIPELRLATLDALMTSFMADPNLILKSLFPIKQTVSDLVVWESQVGTRGLAKFVAPGDKSPRVAPIGSASHSATVAFLKESMYFDENFLNNLRKVGTLADYQTSAETLANNMSMLENRMARRREWMVAQMLTAGTITYLTQGARSISVDYGIPSAHKVTLATDYKWSTGASRDILTDISNAITAMNNANGARITHMFMNSTTLKHLAKDPTLRTLLQKSTYGDGTLFQADDPGRLAGVNVNVLKSFLNMQNLVVYDEQYVVKSHLTAAFAASATALYVDEVQDFVDGATLRVWDATDESYEDVTISTVNEAAGTLTTSAVTAAHKAREDYVTMTRTFIPDTVVVFFAANVEGRPVAEIKEAPYGLARKYGMNTDSWEEKDPEGVNIRVQDKLLPVLKQRDALYILTVA
jgi:hypothetical protein